MRHGSGSGKTHHALFRRPLQSASSVMDVFCLFVFILILERELLFFLQRDGIVFAFVLTHASRVCVCVWMRVDETPSLFFLFVRALCWLCTHRACQAV